MLTRARWRPVLMLCTACAMLSCGQKTDHVVDGDDLDGGGDGGDGEVTDSRAQTGDYSCAGGSDIQVLLAGGSISVDPAHATVTGSSATLTSAATYCLSGLLADGQIVVSTAGSDPVRLVLNGVDLRSSTGSPLVINHAEAVELFLAPGAANFVQDAATYAAASGDSDTPNAAVYSSADLAILGEGALTVEGRANDGITSKDGLRIDGGSLAVSAADDGIRGKDCIVVSGGQITVTAAGGDGLKADNEKDASRGYVRILGGSLTITAADEGIDATTAIAIDGGQTRIVSGGGHRAAAAADSTGKGLKAGSRIDLGGGELSIDAADDAVHTKGTVVVGGGTLDLASGDDGIHADASIAVQGGAVDISASVEGIEAAEVAIADGLISVVCSGDAVDAGTALTVSGGSLTLTSGGGSSRSTATGVSAKALKATSRLIIEDGTFAIDSADDGVHTNGNMVIRGGSFTIASGDDGVHADSTLTIGGGQITITKSYEGIESAQMTIDDGTIHLVASDDGINLAGGSDGSGNAGWPGGGGPGGGGPPGGGGGMGGEVAGDYHLYIHGGYIAVTAGGDGLDSNGYIEMTGGTVLVHGPTANDNGAIDYVGTFQITGGLLVAVGSSGMAEAPDATSSQCSLLANLQTAQAAGSLVHIQTADGVNLLTFAPSKKYQSLAFSSPALAIGAGLEVYLGGTCTGAAADGLYQGGTYSPGTRRASFSISRVVTKLMGV